MLPASYWGSFEFNELKDKLVLATKLKHGNIVQLLGVCLEQREKLLVYEYLPNAGLDTILYSKLVTLYMHSTYVDRYRQFLQFLASN
jgi:hypothetical protein